MSLEHSPQIVTNGLILNLDAANRKSYIGAISTSLINTDSWTVSNGGIGGYGAISQEAENQRTYSDDPWGNQSIVWGTYPSGDGGADGGWNIAAFADNTKLYRFSVWVRRTSSTGGGTFYFGCNDGVRSISDSADRGNPYWDCQGTGALTQNQWYLVCGHIFPHNTTNTINHPNTGYFTIANGVTLVKGMNFCNIGSDLKWNPAQTTAVHRTYHFYCGDATTRLQFMAPRIDLCDGNEPSIYELLNNGNSFCKNINNDKLTLNNIIYNYTDKTFNFNSGSPSSITIPLATSFNKLEGTINMWVYPTSYNGGNGYFVNRTDSTPNAVDWLWVGPYSGTMCFRIGNGSDCCSLDLLVGNWYSYVPLNTWKNLTFSWKSGVTSNIYINGDLITSRAISTIPATNPESTGRIGLGHGNADSYFNGKIPITQFYNRMLPASEIKQNFNALRGRYGI
jgi:hypothetical protein